MSSDAHTDSAPPALEPGPSSGLPYALLAHPVVQAVRFLTKASLAWFLTAGELGDAMLVGLFAFLAQHVALFGLDDAVVYAPRLSRPLWRSLRRFLDATGLVLTLGVVVAGQVLARALDAPGLGGLALVLAPTVWIGNLAVLPTALLVRRRHFRAVFWIDLWSVCAFALVTLSLSALGAGAWSLVAGWYANAIAAVLVAHVRARGLWPTEPGDADQTRSVLRYGAHLTGASLLGFGGERVDSFAIGLGVGRAALGLYEWALHLSQFAVQYASSLSERFLFPTLADRHRKGTIVDSFREAVRLCITFVLPVHVTLAVTAVPFVRGCLPREWESAGPLLGVLALAGACRSIEVVFLAALKATGDGRAVLRLSGLRLALLVVAVALTLAQGLFALALGVLAARALAAVLTLLFAGRLPDVRACGLRRVASAGIPCFLSWCTLYLPLAWFLSGLLAPAPRVLALATVTTAAVVWLLVRVFLDRKALRWEWSRLAHELGGRSG